MYECESDLDEFKKWVEKKDQEDPTWGFYEITSTRTERNGRLFWDIKFQETRTKKYELFQISWKDNLDEDKARSACETLVLAFDAALNFQYMQPEFSGLEGIFSDYGMGSWFVKQGERVRERWSRTHFQKLWEELTCSEDASESLTEVASESLTKEASSAKRKRSKSLTEEASSAKGKRS
eukprot:GHVP01040813.1.p1 GENE.GHVP01040813.1~~GHVP01040813.1.p1  ORF type:complete len:202 (-),score=26.09 GHVP01040813.1:34-573(-)